MAPIARYFSSVDAHVARLRLLAAGIPSWLEGEFLCGLVGYAGGPGEVRLWVHPDDHEAACVALYEPPADASPDEALAAALQRERRRYRWRFILLLLMGMPFAMGA